MTRVGVFVTAVLLVGFVIGQLVSFNGPFARTRRAARIDPAIAMRL